MRDSHPGRTPAGSLQEDEELARRLWVASSRRAQLAAQQKRWTAARIYWQAALEIARKRIDGQTTSIFEPCHLIEPMQGLVEFFVEQGNWMAARSLLTEVADFFARNNIYLSGYAERTFQSTAGRIAAVQRQSTPALLDSDNVEVLPALRSAYPAAPYVSAANAV